MRSATRRHKKLLILYEPAAFWYLIPPLYLNSGGSVNLEIYRPVMAARTSTSIF